MSSDWMVLGAALGASALTGFFGFGYSWLQGRRETKTTRWQSRRSAYSRLLAATGLVVHAADAFHFTMENRSGVGEGVDVTLHYRQPLDTLDLHELLSPVTTALYESMADVWTVGTPEAVRLGNVAVGRCADVMRAATETGQGRSRLGTRLLGVKWTEEQLESWRVAERSLALARAEFAKVARQELGVEVTDLLLQPDREA